MLTLHVPGPPDCVVKADLVSPEQLQTFEVLPLGRDQLPAERKKGQTNQQSKSVTHQLRILEIILSALLLVLTLYIIKLFCTLLLLLLTWYFRRPNILQQVPKNRQQCSLSNKNVNKKD